MKLSAKAEYACVAMVELATRFRTGQPVQIKTIAEAHTISQRFLVQILLQLKGAGLVASSRGMAGGYQLARTAETITLAEIIYAIDRSPQPAAFGDLSPSAIVQSLRELWKEVSSAERHILERTTLADLLQRSQESEGHSYQI
ncbi:MAG: Rrf2 family transcriptional regulator [Acidobacteriales bacterium]|nr:Rrf2 family transcriptional regulator [Terriglobales bacterium]